MLPYNEHAFKQRMHKGPVVIEKLAPYDTEVMLQCDMQPLNMTVCEHIGQTLSILRRTRNSTIATLYHKVYKITCNNGDYAIQTLSSETYNIEHNDNIYDNVAVASTAATTLMFAFQPTKRMFIHKLINEIYGATLPIQRPIHKLITMLDKRNNRLNTIDIDSAHISLRNVNVTRALQLNAHINNTYVNMIHDCHNVCSHILLCNGHKVIPSYAVLADSVECIYKLSDARKLYTTVYIEDDDIGVSLSGRHMSTVIVVSAVGVLLFIGSCVTFYVL